MSEVEFSGYKKPYTGLIAAIGFLILALSDLYRIVSQHITSMTVVLSLIAYAVMSLLLFARQRESFLMIPAVLLSLKGVMGVLPPSRISLGNLLIILVPVSFLIVLLSRDLLKTLWFIPAILRAGSLAITIINAVRIINADQEMASLYVSVFARSLISGIVEIIAYSFAALWAAYPDGVEKKVYVPADDDGGEKRMKFCVHCGKEIMEEAVICPHCGCSVGEAQLETDVPGTGLNILSFLFPLVGLILFLVYHENSPRKANGCGKFALIGFIIGILLSAVGYGFILSTL